jgi:assimilatory nitrate reductase catalytic subunit
MTETRTTCPYCGVGCGVVASVTKGEVTVRGDETHPANYGRLCVKGSALGETTGLEGRLLRPMIDDVEVDWSQALETSVYGRLSRLTARRLWHFMPPANS